METVVLPDLFQSFLATSPQVHPRWKEVGLECQEWVSNFCGLSPKLEEKLRMLQFEYFMGILAPGADIPTLRLLCKWGNWIFLYDDWFDDGTLRFDKSQAKGILRSLLSPFSFSKRFLYSDKRRERLVKAHDVWAKEFASVCSKDTLQRYVKIMHIYNKGILGQYDNVERSAEEMMDQRQASSGVAPCFPLIELIYRLKLPNFVFKSPVIQKLETLSVKMVYLTNDILSYAKEEVLGTTNNVVAAHRLSGLSAQQAFDAVGETLFECYRLWEETELMVPAWGQGVDDMVKTYVMGLKLVVQANLEWSFHCRRYFGDGAEIVKRTRLITVQKEPSYLAVARGYCKLAVESESHDHQPRPGGEKDEKSR